jgi:hypothetical protein
MAENLDPPRIAGRHFFLDIKTVHFGRNGTSNSTTEAAAAFQISESFIMQDACFRNHSSTKFSRAVPELSKDVNKY